MVTAVGNSLFQKKRFIAVKPVKGLLEVLRMDLKKKMFLPLHAVVETANGKTPSTK